MAGQRVITMFGFFVLKQDEIGVRLNLGRLAGRLEPGPGFCIPILQQIYKTTSSLETIDLPEQRIVLNGNISVTISGNLNFRVAAPERALLEVSNYRYSMQQLALTTIADVLGMKTIEEVRSEKLAIANEIEAIVARNAERWGLAEVDIRLTDARLDDNLQRAMMRETEAQKEANAVRIRAESDRITSEVFAHAARELAKEPGAMTLRVLQTLTDVSNDKTTVVVPLPIELLSGMMGGNRATPAATASVEPTSQPTVEREDAQFPVAELKLKGDKTVTDCPQCGTVYNVTEVLGNMRYDEHPDIPGQQIKCRKCETIFTLPEAGS